MSNMSTSQLLEEQYIEYLYNHAIVGNGTMLINLMEDGYLFDDFLDSIGMTLEQWEEIVQ